MLQTLISAVIFLLVSTGAGASQNVHPLAQGTGASQSTHPPPAQVPVSPSTKTSQATYPLAHTPNRTQDLTALQHGAQLFIHNCLTCHAARAVRYRKLTELGLSLAQIKENFLVAGQKLDDPMTSAMAPQDAKKWFGRVPPDLAAITRATSQAAGRRGIDYIYTYLRSFYRDASRPTGWNNLVAPNGNMPHVLAQYQASRALTLVILQTISSGNGNATAWERVTTEYDTNGYASVKSESVTAYPGGADFVATFRTPDSTQVAQPDPAFDEVVADLSAFLAWMAEPEAQFRKKIGLWVLLFLGLFLFIAKQLNNSYWKHVK